jgi:Secretion system C-terminal sorting domain
MKQTNIILAKKYLFILLLLISNLVQAQSFNDRTDDVTAPTPVKLLTFGATKFNTDILVKWETAQEINNSHYIIERSTDGISFSSVGQVKGNENSNVIVAYNFLDVNAPTVNLYYRLKQVDVDGTFTYSDVVLVRAGKSNNGTISIFPNPIADYKININISNLPKVKGEINIISTDGKKVFTTYRNFAVENSLLQLQIPSSILPGTYLLQIVHAKAEINVLHKIIIQ